MTAKRIVESSMDLPSITGGASVNVFNDFGPDIEVFKSNEGKVFVCVDDLIGMFTHMSKSAKSFARKQSDGMAPQASYNVGEFKGMETLIDKLCAIENDGKDIPSAV